MWHSDTSVVTSCLIILTGKVGANLIINLCRKKKFRVSALCLKFTEGDIYTQWTNESRCSTLFVIRNIKTLSFVWEFQKI